MSNFFYLSCRKTSKSSNRCFFEEAAKKSGLKYYIIQHHQLYTISEDKHKIVENGVEKKIRS